jgi:hypothetical protein
MLRRLPPVHKVPPDPVSLRMAVAAAFPGERRRRDVTADRAASRRTVLPINRRLLLPIDDRSKACAVDRRHLRVPARVRLAYGLVAALALCLLLLVTAPGPNLSPAQDVNQLVCAILLLSLATAAGLGLCRTPLVRRACTLTGAWLMLSPLFLPGAFSNTAFFGGLGTFGAAGWAADEMKLCHGAEQQGGS